MSDVESSLPVWVCFSGVLSDMLSSSGTGQKRMFLFTDNISRPPTGDVHKGACNPRKFFDWLHDNNLMNVTEHLHYPVASYTVDFKGKVRNARAMINKGKKDMKRRYNRINKQLPENATRRDWWNESMRY